MEPIPTTFIKISPENIKQEVFENIFNSEDVSISCIESTKDPTDKVDEQFDTMQDDIEDKIDEELDNIDKDQTGKHLQMTCR